MKTSKPNLRLIKQLQKVDECLKQPSELKRLIRKKIAKEAIKGIQQ